MKEQEQTIEKILPTLRVSKNAKTVIFGNEVYKSTEVTPEEVIKYPTLCNICDLYQIDCNKVNCLKAKRLDNKEVVFKFIKKITKII